MLFWLDSSQFELSFTQALEEDERVVRTVVLLHCRAVFLSIQAALLHANRYSFTAERNEMMEAVLEDFVEWNSISN